MILISSGLCIKCFEHMSFGCSMRYASLSEFDTDTPNDGHIWISNYSFDKTQVSKWYSLNRTIDTIGHIAVLFTLEIVIWPTQTSFPKILQFYMYITGLD